MIDFELGQQSLEQVKRVFVRPSVEAGESSIVYNQPLAINELTALLHVSLRDREQIFTHQH